MKNIFKRTTSAILSLVIVISACSGIFSTVATGGTGVFDHQLVESDGTSDVPDASTSVVKSTTVAYKDWNYSSASEKTYDASLIAQISDSQFVNFDLSGTSYVKKRPSDTEKQLFRDGSVIYTDIVHTLDGVCDISDVLVVNRDASSSYWWISYKIYASNQRDKLFSGEPVFEYDNTGAISRTQRFKTTNFKAKYVGMRVIAATSSTEFNGTLANNQYYIRMQEFNVYGAKDTDYGKPAEDTELALPTSPSRSVVKKATAQYTNGTDKTPATLNFSEQLYDKTLGQEATVDVTASPYYSETDKYVDVILQLKGEQDINDIYVAHNATADYIARKYSLYIGNSEDTLFSGDPYYTYESASPKATQHYEVSGYKGSYVGMRIEKPHADSVTGTDSLVRLREFNVYTDTPAIALKEIKNDDTVSDLPTGTSVVKSAEVYYKSATASQKVLSSMDFDGSSSELTPLEAMTDSKANLNLRAGGTFAEGSGTISKIHLNDGEAYTDIVYTLEGLCDIENVVVIGRDADKWSLSYKLYAGNDKETLFNSDPVITYDNTTNKTRTQVYSSEDLSVKYIAMRITGATATNVLSEYQHNPNVMYARICEFNVMGTVNTGARAPASSGNDVAFPTNSSLVKSAEAYYYNGTDRNAITLTDSKKLYDGSLSGVATGNKTDSPMNVSGNYTDIVLELKKEANVTDLYIANAPEAKYYAREYSIYIGTDKDTLFDKVYYTYKTETPSRIQLYEIEPILARAKYVGIRVKTAHASSVAAAESFVRLAEFNAYGETEAFKKVTECIDYKIPEGTSLEGLTNLTHPDTTIEPVLKGYDAEGESPKQIIAGVTGSTPISQLSDGDPKTKVDFNRPVFAEADSSNNVTDYNVGKKRYLDIYYDLKSVADLSHIVLAFPTSPGLVPGYYEIYLADTKGELYQGEPYVTVDNATQFRTTSANDQMNIINFDKYDEKKDEARFVGIRIYSAISEKLGDSVTTTLTYGAYNAVHVRLTEFAVYGKYVDESFDPTKVKPDFIPTKNIDVTKIETLYGENILKPDCINFQIGGQGANTATAISTLQTNFGLNVLSRKGEDFAKIHSDFLAGNYMKPGKDIDLIVELKEWDLTAVQGFIYQGTWKDSEYMTSDYEVYIADEKEDLFTGIPVFVYNEDKYEMCNGQVVEFAEPIKGKWFAIRVKNAVYTATVASNYYLRTSIMFAWGYGVDVKEYPANVAENMPLDASLVTGNKRTAVSDKNLTVQEQKNLTDTNLKVEANGDKTYTSITKTYGTIDTNGKDLELVYNLCGDIDVSKLSVNTLIDSTHGFKTLKVYASDIMQGVYDKDSLVWTYKVGSKTGQISPEKVFKKTKQMRYVRFVFEDTKESVRLYTVEVIGPDTQKMKTRNLTANVTNSDYEVFQNDLETGESEEYSVYHGLLNSLTDGGLDSYFVISDGLIGKNTYDLVMALGDLRTVSNIQLNYLKNYEQSWPAQINIYIGETKEDAMNKKKPDVVAKSTDVKNGVLSFDVKPRLARYIRFELAKFNPVDYYVDRATGRDIITTTLADLKVMGTKVKGVQTDPDNETLLTYTDKKTNISLSLKRLDINDIFTDAVGIRVTPEKATNWQMKSLCNNPYFKIIDKKIYKIELVDLFGNTITDVDGREITLTAKTPKGYEGMAMFGNATKRTTVSLIETEESEGVMCATYEFEQDVDNKIAILGMISEDDPYWSTIGELEDFAEGSEEDLMGSHDAEWYKSIHTTDGRFTVTPLLYEIETGVRFTATDVSADITDTEYENVLINTPEKSVAVFYDMQIAQNGSALIDGNAYEIAMVLPEHIRDNYSEFEVYYSDGMGGVTPLYVEEWDGVLTFQTLSMGNIAIVGTAGENAFNAVGNTSGPVNTGESRTAATAVIMLLTAAAFVVTLTAKKTKAEQS